MRTLLEAEAAGNARAALAVDVFCYRLRKYIAAYVGALGGLDALAFAGGIGENAPPCAPAPSTGLDGAGPLRRRRAQRGGRPRGGARSLPGGRRARVFVVPTNEELLIARDTCCIVEGRPLA